MKQKLLPGDSSRDPFGMVSSRDPFKGLRKRDLQRSGMKFGHGLNHLVLNGVFFPQRLIIVLKQGFIYFINNSRGRTSAA